MRVNEDQRAADEFSTSAAEARSLVVDFAILEETLDQQLNATRITLLILAGLLMLLGFLLSLPNATRFNVQDLLLLCSVVVAFGLVFMSAIYFRLKGTLRSARIARHFLQCELDVADSAVKDVDVRNSTLSGGGLYA